MEIDKGIYTVKLNRLEIVDLCRSFDELKTLQGQCPDARNGYDLMTQERVNVMHNKIKKAKDGI
tara:strand:- start:187 stop:378 length:192 start_codon:yes stop_codon:yes gene_type:complete